MLHEKYCSRPVLKKVSRIKGARIDSQGGNGREAKTQPGGLILLWKVPQRSNAC